MKSLITDILTKILKQLQLEFNSIKIDDSDAAMIRVDIDSPKASRLIGWHGETVNSLQHILKSIIRSKNKLERSPFIVLDIDGYKRMQEEKVCRTAEQKADFVRRKKTRVALPPMSPYLRKIVHTYVANNPDMQDLMTESVGEGDYRQIVLMLKTGSIEDGEELAPIISNDEPREKTNIGEDSAGFENLDI